MRNLIMPLLAAGALFLSAAPAYADLGDQLFKLLPDDGAADNAPEACGGRSGSVSAVGKCACPP